MGDQTQEEERTGARERGELTAAEANSSDEALLARFRRVRAATLRFTAPLSAEDMMVQSCGEASPAKWHLAHTSWFFETFVLTPYAKQYKPFHPEFCWLFNSYYNSLGDMPAKNLRASFSRPTLDSILEYRRHVDSAIGVVLGSTADEHSEEVVRRIVLGLEHEQQHLELIATDIKHALFTNPLQPAYVDGERDRNGSEPASGNAEKSGQETFSEFSGGLTEMGITPDPTDPEAFAFDNETPRHTVFLQPYALANRLVTGAEYLDFVNDNGYTRPELWLSEGWTTLRDDGWQAPLYWKRNSADPTGWSVFTLHGLEPFSRFLDAPVCHVSFFEADAFARWRGCRLPTESEWEHAAVATGCAGRGNMLESDQLHPVATAGSGSLEQMFGDVWEWTASCYTGYPGYKPLPGALGEYNGKFMSSQVILRGGSCVTPAQHIRATYRNFFGPATRWQFSGIRLARDVASRGEAREGY